MLLRFPSLFVFTLLVGFTPFAVGCASGPSAQERGRSTTVAGTVTFRDLSTDSSMTIVSESMLERLGIEGDTPEERTMRFFSSERSNANTKVCPDDGITAIVDHMEKNGFAKWAVHGEAPATPVDSKQWIQVRTNDEVRHMLNPRGTAADPDAKLKFFDFVQLIVGVYNELPQHQTVKDFDGFEQPTLTDRQRRAKSGRL